MPGFSFREPAPRSFKRIVRDRKENPPPIDESSEHEESHPSLTWGRGIVKDFKKTIGTHWCSEVVNFNSKTIAVSLFMFIAVIAPTITFGAVYAKRTENQIGAVELLIATAWCGMFYAIFSGQPMMINGGTGPVLTFQVVCYELSQNIDVPFLTLNAWVGIWICGYMILAGFFDFTRILHHCTRFTDEIFAFLIVSIFLLDALGNPASMVGVLHYFNPDHPHNLKMAEEESGYDYMTVALLSLLLCFATAYIGLMLRKIRYSAFCCNDFVRSLVTDFAITIAVLIMTVLKHTIFSEIPSEELNVPETIAPTFACCDASCQTYFPDDCTEQAEAWGRREWIVDLGNLNGKAWVPFMAAGPAALAFVLIFLDNGITWHIVNHPSNKITHGDAYNYDTCVSAIMVLVNSLFGLPWLVASTVPCIMHVTAMSEKNSKGETERIQETRLTGFFTHVLVLGTVFATEQLKLIPLPVLYGVFLFMGLVALPAQQLWQRVLLFFQEPAKYPETCYTKYLEIKTIHKFTLIQLGFFTLHNTIRAIKAISIAFPLMMLLCIPARIYMLPRIFNKDELTLLDGTPEEIEDWIYKKESLGGAKAGSDDVKEEIHDFVGRNNLTLPKMDAIDDTEVEVEDA